MSPSSAYRATARFCRDFGPSANAKVRDPKVRASTPQIDRGSTQRPYPGPEGTGLATRTLGDRASELGDWLEHHHQVCRWTAGRSPLRVSLSPETGVSAPSRLSVDHRRSNSCERGG